MDRLALRASRTGIPNPLFIGESIRLSSRLSSRSRISYIPVASPTLKFGRAFGKTPTLVCATETGNGTGLGCSDTYPASSIDISAMVTFVLSSISEIAPISRGFASRVAVSLVISPSNSLIASRLQKGDQCAPVVANHSRSRAEDPGVTNGPTASDVEKKELRSEMPCVTSGSARQPREKFYTQAATKPIYMARRHQALTLHCSPSRP